LLLTTVCLLALGASWCFDGPDVWAPGWCWDMVMRHPLNKTILRSASLTAVFALWHQHPWQEQLRIENNHFWWFESHRWVCSRLVAEPRSFLCIFPLNFIPQQRHLSGNSWQHCALVRLEFREFRTIIS
jgi:hypothetical protein